MTTPHLPTLLAITRAVAHDNASDLLLPQQSNNKEWNSLLEQLELYGLSNLFWKLIQDHDVQIPTSTTLSLRALGIRHRAAADARHAIVSEISTNFDVAQLPFFALKGLALAPMLYQRDELRPMRDIDLLVPRSRQEEAGQILRDLGFELPKHQPSKFMRDSHHLPNATKVIDGFKISVEVHNDALSRDISDHLHFSDIAPNSQSINWRGLNLSTLGHELMLYQVCRHLAGVHPGAALKMINVLDVVLYAEQFNQQVNWRVIEQRYPHVINTLRCLHLIVPLSASLTQSIGGVKPVAVAGVGESMLPFTQIAVSKKPVREKIRMLLSPPDWWLHLYYNQDLNKSLTTTKLVRHPATVLSWVSKRLSSWLLP